MVRVGIVGLGSIGRVHADAIAAAGGEVVASAGRSDVAELLARDDVDVVAICTPSGTHAQQAIDAIAAGRNVVVEKPLAMTYEDGQRVVRAARERGVFLSVMSQRRLEPPQQHLRSVLAGGSLGRAVLGEALVRWWREPAYYASAAWRGTVAHDGGALMNQAIHVVDLLRWHLGPVDAVAATTATTLHAIEAEDTAVASLRFTSGAVGSIVATTATRPGVPAELNLYFEHGSVAIHGTDVVRWDVPAPPPPTVDAARPGSGAADPRSIGVVGHTAQWRDIFDALATGRAPAVTGEDALATLALVLAVYESSRTGRAVRPAA